MDPLVTACNIKHTCVRLLCKQTFFFTKMSRDVYIFKFTEPILFVNVLPQHQSFHSCHSFWFSAYISSTSGGTHTAVWETHLYQICFPSASIEWSLSLSELLTGIRSLPCGSVPFPWGAENRRAEEPGFDLLSLRGNRFTVSGQREGAVWCDCEVCMTHIY